MLSNLWTPGSQLQERMVPTCWNQCLPILEPRVPSLNNSWLPNLGTNASQFWKHGFPVWRTARSQTLEPTLQSWNLRFLVLQTNGSQTLEPMIPNLGTRVPSSRNAWFPQVGTNASQSWNHGFPVWRTAASQTLEPMLPSLGTMVSSLKNCLFANLGTNASILVPSSPNERFPNPGTNDPQSWSLGFPILGTSN